MNKDTLISDFLNGQSTEEVTAAFVWGLIGLSFSIILELIRGSHNIKTNGGFKFTTWILDNTVRTVASIFLIAIGSVFGEMITGEIPIWASCLVGFFTDKVIEAIIKFKSNVDITKFIVIFTKKK